MLKVANATDVQAEFQQDSADLFFDLVGFGFCLNILFRLLLLDMSKIRLCAFFNELFDHLYNQALRKNINCFLIFWY